MTYAVVALYGPVPRNEFTTVARTEGTATREDNSSSVYTGYLATTVQTPVTELMAVSVHEEYLPDIPCNDGRSEHI